MAVTVTLARLAADRTDLLFGEGIQFPEVDRQTLPPVRRHRTTVDRLGTTRCPSLQTSVGLPALRFVCVSTAGSVFRETGQSCNNPVNDYLRQPPQSVVIVHPVRLLALRRSAPERHLTLPRLCPRATKDTQLYPTKPKAGKNQALENT